MTQLVFHIGYHKTATSWMQQRLFTAVHGYCAVGGHEDVFAHIVQPLSFDFDPTSMRNLLRERQAQVPAGHVPVLSSELLSGHPFLGGRESDIYAKRLHEIAPDARILISIRNQLKILPSVYMQYVRRGGTMPYDQFFRCEDDLGYFGFNPLHFAYDRLISLYQSLFGADQVVVVSQESFQSDIDAATSDLARVLGANAFSGLDATARAPFAPSYPEFAAPVLRRINHVQSSVLHPVPVVALGKTPGGIDRWVGAVSRRPPFTTMFGKHRPVSGFVKERFAGFYTESNKRLAEIVRQPLDLSMYP